jgi:uncharacterized protein
MRLLLYVLLGLVIYYLLRGLLESKPKEEKLREFEDELVKDPICGIYIPKNKAITAKVEGAKVYFCSRECKEKYLEEKRRGK